VGSRRGDATRKRRSQQEPRSANNGIALAVCRIWTIQQDCAVATNRSCFVLLPSSTVGGSVGLSGGQTRLSVVAGGNHPGGQQRTKNRTDNRRNIIVRLYRLWTEIGSL